MCFVWIIKKIDAFFSDGKIKYKHNPIQNKLSNQNMQQQPQQQQMNEQTEPTINTAWLNEWSRNGGSSIFIKRIPEWLSKESIQDIFKEFGEISRVHIVDVAPDKGEGRMAFVHFENWHTNQTSNLARFNIRFSKDNTHTFPITNSLTNQSYNLFITFNRRPIPKTTYDNDQLTDMINKLNHENANLKREIQEMRNFVYFIANQQQMMIQQQSPVV